jgi:hypothetical protein
MFSNVSCSLNMTSTLYCYLLFVKLLFVYIVEWPLFVVCSTSIVYIVEWPLFVVCSTSICLHCGVTSICCLFNYYLFTLWSDLYLLFVQLVLFTLWSDLYLLFVQLLFAYIVEWPLFVVCSTIFVYIVEWPVLHYFARGNIPSICNVNVNVNLDISCMYN